MKVAAFVVGIFILSGFSCLVLGDDGDLVPDKQCEYNVALQRSITIRFQLISTFMIMSEAEMPKDFCEKLKMFELMDAVACQKSGGTADEKNVYLARLKAIVDENYKKLCDNPAALKKSVECIEKLKKKTEIISSCQKPFAKEFPGPPEKVDPLVSLRDYKLVTYKNMTSVCCAIRELASCYKKVILSCKNVHQTLVPLMYNFVEFQLTGRIEENVCTDEVCGSDSTGISSRLQCIQPKLMITVIIVVHILSRAIF